MGGEQWEVIVSRSRRMSERIKCVCTGIAGWRRLAARRLAVTHQDEEGQLSILSLVVLLTLVLSLCAVVNVVHAVRGKLETQNAADGLTQAAANEMARGLNVITAANHLIGEMHALSILHHALGGDDLDEGNDEDRTPSDLRAAVTMAYQFARTATLTVPELLRPDETPYDDAFDEDIIVEAALGKSFLHLKKVAFYAYYTHFLAGVLYSVGEIVEKIPVVSPLGTAIKVYAMSIMGACCVFEWRGYGEWQYLALMQRIASQQPIPTMIEAVRDQIIPVVYSYSLVSQVWIPKRMLEVVDETADYHGVTGSLFPGLNSFPIHLLSLPVTKEPEEIAEESLWRSQLMRASVPWVHYWRLPLLEMAEDALLLSRFKAYYVEFTQSDLVVMTTRAKADNNIHLLILKDRDVVADDKGEEPWTYSEGSSRADSLFALVGFAHRPRRPIAAPRFFDSPHDDGWAAFAQAMIYNANQQTRESGSEEWQAEIGWDTLNFAGNRVPEWKGGEDPDVGGDTPASDYRDRAPEPKVKLSWKTLMVPTTRIKTAASYQDGDLGGLLDRSLINSPAARTH